MSILIRHVTGRTTSLVSLLALTIFLPLFVTLVFQAYNFVSKASGTPAVIFVDTKAEQEQIKTDFYHSFAQGGEERTDMLASVTADVKALKPKYIRLDHLYDNYSVVDRSGGGLTYNWGALDRAVDSILATGAKPVLALSYMPSVIAKDGAIINPPNDWNEWAQVVTATIEHFSGKSQRNLNGVQYEVWNEPDLEQFGKWSLGGDKNYLTLYKYAAIGASNAKGVNSFGLGGPATTGLYQRWIEALVQSGSRVDFLSWHSYLPNPKQYATDQRNLIKWLLPYPTYTLLPKYITEFGFTGAKSKGYGTSYGAAHTVAVIRQLISGGPTALFTFQLKDGPGQAEGDGWGLITGDDNGLRKKPRYFVFNFLDSMAGTRLALTGEGSWVTGFASKKDNKIRVLLVNFDQSGSHAETVPVTFTKLDPGTYTYREKFLIGKEQSSTEEITGDTLTKSVYMYAQAVTILELEKKK